MRIKEKRDTEVGQDELYVNKAKYDHQVIGPYIHKHHNTTREEYVLDTKVDYYQHIKVTEHVGDTRIRNIQETVIINGSEYITHTGTRTKFMWGLETVYHLGRDEHFRRFYPDLKWPSAIDVYLGSGAVIICTVPDGEKFLERARQFYLTDLDSALRNLDFYLPIIDMEDFGKVSENLTKVWFDFFDVYITETKSDPGILIASRHNLDDLMAGFQYALESENGR